MNGDGDLDLVTHTDNSFGARTKVRFGNGDRTFGPPQIMGQVGGTCGSAAKIWLADYDGDDNLDVLCLNGTAQVAFGDGAGNIGSSTPLPLNTTGLSGGVGRTFAHADFDADGHQDVVFMVTNNCCPFGEPWVGHLVIQRYDPTNPRNFVTDGVGVDLGQVSGPEGVAAGDFDEDGLPDVVVHTNRMADGSGGERFMFLKGDGDGSLAAPVTTAPGLPTYAQVEAADVDGDGHLDLVGSGGNAGSVGVVLGNGDGTFDAATVYPADANFDLTLADLNGDGQRDVVTGSWNHGVAVFAARADGTLLPAGYHPTADQRVDGVLTGDLDGDGKPEVVTTVYTDPHVTVLENTSTFGPPVTDPDLRPTTVAAPSAIEAGAVGDITYTVQNQGAPITGGSWVDRVYLSTDGSWDPGDRLFFSAARSGDLQQGASYSQTVTAPFVPVVPGQTKVIVRSDLFGAVDETDEANNLLVMPGSVDVTVPTLAPGVDEDLSVAADELRYRRIDATTDDQQLRAALAVDGAAELVVADGRLPTRTDHDHASPALDQPAIALPANPGARFLLLQGGSSAGGGVDATLSLRDVGFAVLGVEPATGSNQGEATTVVRGGGFVTGAAVAIDDGVAHREATTVTRLADGSLEATFDLTSLPVGTYDITVTNPGPVSATLADAYAVTDEAAGGLEVLLTTPGLMRTNWVTDAVVTVHNTGGTDQERRSCSSTAQAAPCSAPPGRPRSSRTRSPSCRATRAAPSDACRRTPSSTCASRSCRAPARSTPCSPAAPSPCTSARDSRAPAPTTPSTWRLALIPTVRSGSPTPRGRRSGRSPSTAPRPGATT
ncbi:MAG: FG-GAP-like repeat-containing protein [Acidimicrobiales bacterium]